MDAETKAKWISALRSGEFKQGRGTLKRGDEYCCLGVLCAIAGPGFKGNDVAVKWTGGYAEILPISREESDALWPRNDGTYEHHAHSFAEIADYIEQNIVPR